ncbi:MAG: sigma-70 family RNA polymerase sigma factor [Eubacteriales bacterium]|nr:sigma-70 family RNA polymerase sigma factor [Eubacteriales bacterium]
MTRYDNLSDGELLSRFREGEPGISDYLMEKYKELVRKRARAMYLIGGETDDLIQEGMIGLFKAVRDYREDKDTSFQTFACLCIDRQLYNAIQNSNRQKHMPLNSYISLSDEQDESSLGELWAENPESIIIDRETTQALEKEIQRMLSPMENKVLDYFLRGYSYAHIAELMGKSQKSIDNALQRIRGKVKDCVEKYRKTENVHS